MRFKNIDLPIMGGLNVDADVVVKSHLIFNVKLESYLCDCLVSRCVAWGGKYAIIHVDNEYDFTSVEHTVVHPGLSASNLSYTFGEVLAPYPRPLPLSIYILEEIEDVCCPDFSLGFYYFGNLQLHLKFNVVLRKGQDEVQLACAPSIDDGKG